MKVCNLSLDRNILAEGSRVQTRLISLADSVSPKLGVEGEKAGSPRQSLRRSAGEIVVMVPGGRDEERQISPHLRVCAVGGGKVRQFFRMWRVGKRILSEENPSTRQNAVLPLRKGELRHYDLITVQDTAYLALLAYLLARRFRIPFEVQVHGLEKFYGVRKLIAGFVLRRADKIRVVSERLKRELVGRYTLHATRFYVLPVYTQITTPALADSGSHKYFSAEKSSDPALRRRAPALQKLHVFASSPFTKGDKNRPFTFLTVGRLVPVKNVGLQIRAFARLAKEFPEARLVIVGEGALRASLKFKVESLKLEDKIRFEGRQENLARYYGEADTFLLSSDAEGWGLVVTEAAACGLPIIMTDVGLAGEFVRDGENGIVVPVGDEAALIAAMKRVMEDAPFRERISENARRAFEELPSAEEQVKRQIEEWTNFI